MMEERLDDLVVNDNSEFVRCDDKECEERGQYPRCYFDIFVNCDNYKNNAYGIFP
jgi:hypothetical protein